MSSGLDSELESFRQQWLSDLRKKDHHATASSSRTATSPQHRKRRPSSPTKTRRPAPTADDDDGDYVPTLSFDEPPQTGHTLDGSVKSPAEKKLVSALDHYEEAMEREAQGNMGDSLKLYRQAYRVRPPLTLPAANTSARQPHRQDVPREALPQTTRSVRRAAARRSSTAARARHPPDRRAHR